MITLMTIFAFAAAILENEKDLNAADKESDEIAALYDEAITGIEKNQSYQSCYSIPSITEPKSDRKYRILLYGQNIGPMPGSGCAFRTCYPWIGFELNASAFVFHGVNLGLNGSILFQGGKNMDNRFYLGIGSGFSTLGKKSEFFVPMFLGFEAKRFFFDGGFLTFSTIPMLFLRYGIRL